MNKHEFFGILTAVFGIALGFYVGIWKMLVNGVAYMAVHGGSESLTVFDASVCLLGIIMGIPIAIIISAICFVIASSLVDEGRKK